MVKPVIGMFDMDQNTVVLNKNYNKQEKKKNEIQVKKNLEP